MAAYQEFPWLAGASRQLAARSAEEKAPDQLQALIAAHRKARPDDSRIPLWNLEVRWLRQDYEGVLKLLAEDRDDLFALPDLLEGRRLPGGAAWVKFEAERRGHPARRRPR